MSDGRRPPPRLRMKIVADDPKAAARAKVRDEVLVNVLAAARRGDLPPDVVEACIGGTDTAPKSGADRARCSWCPTSQFRD